MNFDLPESHREVQRVVRELCVRHVAPHARAWDEAGRFPREVIAPLAELGLFGVRVPEEYGGAGLDTLACAVVVEEIARCDGSLARTVASHNSLGVAHLLRFGADAQRERLLPRAASGEWLAAWALEEPGSDDPATLRTTALRRGDGWVIDGVKRGVAQGSVGGFCVVFAVTDPGRGADGVTAFVVEHGTAGMRASRRVEALGMRASDTVELTFDECWVRDDARLGALHAGLADADEVLHRARVTTAALALGLGEGALDAAVAYARDRQQFGKPIAEFQAIQWMLADSRTELEAARLLVHRAAWLADHASQCAAEASMAKLYASEAASRACTRALQVHGGYGYTREFPVERHLRDARLCELSEGASEAQRALIARQLLGA